MNSAMRDIVARCSQWWHGATSLSQDGMALTAESVSAHELRDAQALLHLLRPLHLLRLLHPPMVLTSHVVFA